jgi:WS/DGAT/MGAT family acyltransferase
MAQREPIAKVDTAWLRMEQPTNLMMITGVLNLGEGSSFERLVKTVEKRFLAFRRFRQKAVDKPGGAYWEYDEDFDIHAHVRRVALPGAADQSELEEFVSDLASTPLNPSRPLWQFHLVENYIGGSVVIQRIHHCYADGIALVQVMLSLTDPVPDVDHSKESTVSWKKQQASESGVFRRLMEPAREGLDFVAHWGQVIVQEGLDMIQQPEKVSGYLSDGVDVARELIHALTLEPDPKTLFKGKLGPRKRVAWASPVPLAEVKAISKVLGCTVNDVLIAAVTGALRSYMTDHGENPDDQLEIRATVPVNLRPLEHARELGNHFGVVFLSLPIGEHNPLRRVYLVRERMNELKSSKQAAVAFGLLAALGMGPSVLQRPALDLLSEKATTVLTNVPGPQQPLYLAGGRIRDMMFWVPQNGNIGLGISILSYDQKVFFGMITDRKLVPNPNEIIKRFQPELENLLRLGMMLPLDGQLSPELAEELVESALAGR